MAFSNKKHHNNNMDKQPVTSSQEMKHTYFEH